MTDETKTDALDEFGEFFGEDASDLLKNVLDERDAAKSPSASSDGSDDDSILDALLDGDVGRAESMRQRPANYHGKGVVE